jgi:hypothetical protein
MARVKRFTFNLKRHKGGVYSSPDGRFYAVRMLDKEAHGWWTVGEVTPEGNQHIEDFPSYAACRTWIMNHYLPEKTS